MADDYLAKPSKLDLHHKPSPTRYDDMVYRRCGASGLRLPALTLGLWQNIGDEVPYLQARETLLGAFDLGITHFDLGNNYGRPPGSSERVLGRVLREDLSAYRDELLIATKAGYDMWPGPYGEGGSKKYLLASCDQSLQRLGLDYVDIFYSHRFDGETPLEETVEALSLLVRQGKALYVGISSYGSEETRRAHALLLEAGVKTLIVHQPSYSLFNRWIETELLDTLEELGMGCAAFTVLAQGLLTDKYTGDALPEVSRAANPSSLLPAELLTEDVLQRLRGLAAIAASRGQTLAQLAIAWVLRDPRVATVVIGARNINQLRESTKALDKLTFSQEELAAIDAFASDVSGVNLWPPNC
jgi:L-glyceraldehyde 3-phosphate reductase